MRFHLALLAASLAIAGGVGADPVYSQIQLLPAGEFAARDGRPGPGKTWKVSESRAAQLAADINAVLAKKRMPVDYDHQTLYASTNGGKAPAAGWIDQVEWRAGEGLFARVKWTPTARQHLAAEEYLYISPVIVADPQTGEVTNVAMAALVNYPALLEIDAAMAQALAAGFIPDHPTQPTEPQPMKTVLAALCALLSIPVDSAEPFVLEKLNAFVAGIPPAGQLPVALAAALSIAPNAGEAAALAAVNALRTSDASALAAMQALQGQLATLTAQINGDKLNATVEQALNEGRLLPAQKAWALELGKRDLVGLQAYLAATPIVPGFITPQTTGNHDPKGRSQGAALAADVDALKVAAQMGIKPEAWKAQAEKLAA